MDLFPALKFLVTSLKQKALRKYFAKKFTSDLCIYLAFFLANDYRCLLKPLTKETLGFGRGITYSNGDVKNNVFDRYRLYVSGLVFHIRKLSVPMHLFFT